MKFQWTQGTEFQLFGLRSSDRNVIEIYLKYEAEGERLTWSGSSEWIIFSINISWQHFFTYATSLKFQVLTSCLFFHVWNLSRDLLLELCLLFLFADQIDFVSLIKSYDMRIIQRWKKNRAEAEKLDDFLWQDFWAFSTLMA